MGILQSRKFILPAALAASAFLFLPISVLEADEDYAISLERPAHVGDRWHVEGSSTQGDHTGELTVDGVLQPPGKPHSIVDKLSAEEEVLEVNAVGHISGAKISVHSFTRTQDDKTTDFVPADIVLVIKWNADGKESITSNDQPYALKNALVELICNIRTQDDVLTADREVGSTNRQKIGDSWPGRTKGILERLRISNQEVDPSNITASAKLLEAKKSQGMDCLRIETKINIKPMTPLDGSVTSTEGISDAIYTVPIQPDMPVISLQETDTDDIHWKDDVLQGKLFKTHEISKTKMTRFLSDIHLASEKK